MLGMLTCIRVLAYRIEHLLKLSKSAADENNSVPLSCILGSYATVTVSSIALSTFWAASIELVSSIFFYFVEQIFSLNENTYRHAINS